jgi:hypothetical protein
MRPAHYNRYCAERQLAGLVRVEIQRFPLRATRYARYELGRFKLPSAREARAKVCSLSGSWSAVYLRAPAFYRMVPHAPAWMNVTFNRERRAFMAAVDGKGEFAFHTQLKPHEDPDCMTEADALAMFQAAAGAPIPAEILSRGTWTAGHALVADGSPFAAAAQRMGLDLRVVDVSLEAARDLYEADLALIRPDQIVAWRGNAAAGAEDVLRRLMGR